MSPEESRSKYRFLIVVGIVAVLLLVALVWIGWNLLRENQEGRALADKVTSACEDGGDVAEALESNGSCDQASVLPGPEGPAGAVGERGPKGDKGDTGAQGPQGPVGPNGTQGIPGPAGAPGLTGLLGPVGPEGPIGPEGPAGTNGVDGQSPPCLNEPAQCRGADGAQGLQGPQGETGPAGPNCPGGYSLQPRDVTGGIPPTTETWLVCVAN